MLLCAVLAAVWAPRLRMESKPVAMIAGALTVFALISWGASTVRSSGARAPNSIEVNGAPVSLAHGRFFVYFFDPECPHCAEVARRLAKLRWRKTTVIGVPTRVPEFALQFVEMTGLKAGISPDVKKLENAFPFLSAPAAAAIENGKARAVIQQFGDQQAESTLRRIGFAE